MERPKQSPEEYLAYVKSLTPSELLEELAQETGVSPAAHIKRLMTERARVHSMLFNTEGKYRVLGVDTYDHIDWVEAEFDSMDKAEQFAAVKNAHALVNPNMISTTFTSDGSVKERKKESTTKYYAYTPDGLGLGIPPEE